ncbi:MAG: hydantoinase/oxoprolinase family protein [Gammaproteobacteria bacterium]|nr:hydantoinase/oxoprolinase family protein [Gammaproteobacteria bacterium]
MAVPQGSGWRISVDTGGTFTDVVVADERGHFTIGKALTTPSRIFEGLRAALATAAAALGLTVADVLAHTAILIYGTTRATNAIVTGEVAKTAYLTSAGFPDVLVLREGGKFDPHGFSKPYPPPYIPRRHTFEITERIDAGGGIYLPLDEDQAERTLLSIKARGFEACAVSLLWSIANPVHELRLGEMIERILPGVPYTLAHALNPILREYRRASSAAIDASIKPLMQAHLRDMQADLRHAGYSGEILVSTTIGGCLDIDSVVARPIHTVRSGPAMGPVAGRRYAEFEHQQESVLVVDTGGTTFDVSLIREGKITITQETWLGEQFTGHMLGISAVDARSVGAGGGSIGWIDTAGLLRVGPRSAGANPGPACYQLGGQEPTVTDAALVLGYIDPHYFLGGRMQLDIAAARAALKTIADPLQISVEAAAYSIFAVSNETMINAIKDITVSEGVDPSEAVIVAGGGAAGLGIMPIARELNCRTVIIPRTASVLSACGMQFSDIQVEHSASMPTRSTTFDRTTVNEALAAIDSHLDSFAARLGARGFNARQTAYRVDAHYAAQVWDISVELPGARLESAADVAQLVQSFHANHRRIFSVDDPASPIEFLNWTGRLSIALPQPLASAPVAPMAPSAPRHIGLRSALFDLDDRREARVYRGEEIQPGAVIEGPAIIEEATTTLVLPPGTRATLSPAGSFVAEFLPR